MLSPLVGLADSDEDVELYRDMNVNDEYTMKFIINTTLKSEFLKMTPKYMERIKITLSYYLTTNKIDFGRVFESNLPSFDSPSNPRDCFIWIWKDFFGDEDFMLNDLDNYIEKENLYEPLRLRR